MLKKMQVLHRVILDTPIGESPDMGQWAESKKLAEQIVSVLPGHQINAIIRMGEGVPEYNRGVMSMLGIDWLATPFNCRTLDVDLALAEVSRLEGDYTDFLPPESPELAQAQQKLARDVAHKNVAWGLIQQVITAAESKHG